MHTFIYAHVHLVDLISDYFYLTPPCNKVPFNLRFKNAIR